ncbi:hypothetical protein GKD41_18550 [Odoribacter splanchnicus]|jgi:hypothetical protein|nr:hypothetical protein [Odoribacter splanchnicus]MSA51766.1 hypothetical protein [Odoribacter splanchnicus]MSA55207.1 hypothetical protein [Odoribacter splanchnicus]MSA63736.1 hypothetical protein [Odoribacter splanchnicus]MSA84590.1 hypothetical protein [Odoribacter splanchnicus]
MSLYTIWSIFVYFILIGSSVLIVEEIKFLSVFFSLFSKILFLYVFFKALFHFSFSKFDILIFIFFIFSILNSYVNQMSIIEIIPFFIKTTGLVLFTEQLIKKDTTLTLYSLSFVFSFIIYLNFILLLIYPDGIWINENGGELYFLGGNYNQFGGVIIPALAVNTLYCFHANKGKFNLFLLYPISLLSVLLPGSGSMTSFLCIILLIIYLVFFHPLKIRKWFLILLFSGLILFALTMVFTQSEVVSGSKLQVFIEDVLQKNMTFSGRTVIWMYSLYMISNSFISGYGWVDKDWALENIHGVITHNIELQILLQGGIILGSIFLFLLYTAIRKQKNKIYDSGIRIFLLVVLTIYFLMLQMECYPYQMILFMLLIVFLSNYFFPYKKRRLKISADE